MDKTRAVDEEALSQRRRKKLCERVEGTTLIESAEPRAPNENKFSPNGQAGQTKPHNDQAVATLTSFGVVMSFLMLFEHLLAKIWRLPALFLSGKPPELLPKAPPKPDAWRIRGIQKVERDAAGKWLQGQAEELGHHEGQGFSLAADSERTFCATLISYERPTPPKASWHVDKDFIGVTPLSDPEDANVDVVAVTGLGGHALGSFRSQDGVLVWLRDFAPKDVPRARFVTYGYDTTVVDSDSNQGVHDLASTLLDRLVDFRRDTQTQQRPLCFVCHSLGGVVVKEALVISSNAIDQEHINQHEVMLGTSGLVLMGVPNLGLRHDQLRTVVNGQPNDNFVTDLLARKDGEPSQYLARLTDDFARLCRLQQQPWRIVSYYEKLGSPTLLVSTLTSRLVR
jgi:hypothetical protein